MYLINKQKSECCGCKACEDVCPVSAIQMQSDAQGFWYPVIEKEKCIHCKKCEKVCAFHQANKNTDYTVYAAWSKDVAFRDATSSGGIFSLLAQQIISSGGVVFGAAFDKDFHVYHTVAKTSSELKQLQKSKYVQSDTANIFSQVRECLEQNQQVLFSGTPCQIAALKSFLEKEYEKLLTCEVLCFGVPSPKVYDAYLAYLQQKYKSPITSIDFKDKRYGWDYYTTNIVFENGKSHCVFGGDSYSTFMRKKWSLRPSCLECCYSANYSVADISLGDFYGVQKYITQKEPKNGVSCVICRTKKGQALLEKIKDSIVFF